MKNIGGVVGRGLAPAETFVDMTNIREANVLLLDRRMLSAYALPRREQALALR